MSIGKKRRIIQLIVFVGMFFVPALNLLEIYFIKGTFISMDIGSLGIADPVMIFQALFAAANYSGVLIASAVIPIFMMLFLGRVWCSWICPYSLILDLAEKIPFLKKRILTNHRKITGEYQRKRTTIMRYGVFVLLFAIVGVSGVPILHLVSPPSVISTEALLLVKSLLITVEILLIVILLVVDLLFSYRFTCRIFCPTGTCLSLFKNRYGLDVSYSGSCVNCGKCERNCPMGLNPMQDTASRLCYNCGRCVDGCPDKSLKWGIK